MVKLKKGPLRSEDNSTICLFRPISQLTSSSPWESRNNKNGKETVVVWRLRRWARGKEVVGSTPGRSIFIQWPGASCSHTRASVTKQYNITLAKCGDKNSSVSKLGVDSRRTHHHLKDFIQQLEWPVQLDLYPARSVLDRGSRIVRPPALHEA